MKDKIMASIFTIFGALIAFGPTYLFKVCEGLKEDGTPMKCHYMAQAQLGIGLVIVVAGILLFLVKSNESKVMLSIMTACLDIVAFLTLHSFIGVCKTPTMPCVALTMPALTIIMVLLLLCSIANIAISMDKQTKEPM